ncbi:MAG: hypothetical protein OJF49_004096 [Ktedonobacterales bacterium]|nr:MAG: hypothetical protein OJF49_004096 [Ktedonobacterales bacterium]
MPTSDAERLAPRRCAIERRLIMRTTFLASSDVSNVWRFGPPFNQRGTT